MRDEQATGEGPEPDEGAEPWGERDSEKLDDGDDERGMESADISGPVPGDD